MRKITFFPPNKVRLCRSNRLPGWVGGALGWELGGAVLGDRVHTVRYYTTDPLVPILKMINPESVNKLPLHIHRKKKSRF